MELLQRASSKSLFKDPVRRASSSLFKEALHAFSESFFKLLQASAKSLSKLLHGAFSSPFKEPLQRASSKSLFKEPLQRASSESLFKEPLQASSSLFRERLQRPSSVLFIEPLPGSSSLLQALCPRVVRQHEKSRQSAWGRKTTVV